MGTPPLPLSLQKKYQKIMDSLKKGGRGQVHLTQDDFFLINLNLENHLTSIKELKILLCILEHAVRPSSIVHPTLFKLMNTEFLNVNGELAIFSLMAFHKHVIFYYQKEGLPFTPEIFNILKKFLESKNLEVREWTLRICETLGGRNIKLKKEILKSRPKYWFFKNRQQKNCIELIKLIEAQWKAKIL